MDESNISLVDLSPQPTAAIRYQASMDKMGEGMGEVFGKLMQYLQTHNLQPAGMPYSTYPAMEPDEQGNWQVISGIPVTGPIQPEGDIMSFELPGGRAATITHIGPYEKLEQSYRTLGQWVEEHELTPAGAMWEVYLTDPSSEPDQAKWRTDIFFPVKAQ